MVDKQIHLNVKYANAQLVYKDFEKDVQHPIFQEHLAVVRTIFTAESIIAKITFFLCMAVHVS